MSFEQLSINIDSDNNKANFKAGTSHDDNPFDNNNELNFSIDIGTSHGGNSFNNAKMNFRSNNSCNNNELNFSVDIGTSYSGDSSDIDNNFDNESGEGHDSMMLSKKQATSIDNNATILVRQTFVDWHDLKQHIDSYTIKQGFATRLSCTENTLGFITRAEIVCHHAGAPSNKSTGLQKTKSIATECPSAIVFDPGYHKLSNNENVHVQTLYDGGVPVPVIVDMLTEQYAELLNTLNNNKEYLVTYSVNNNKLYCLFFAIRFALSTFKRYPEILLIDSTYKTNRFVIGDITVHSIRTLITDRDLALISAVRTKFNILWDCLLTEYSKMSSYMMEQWKPYDNMWAYCHTNKNVNYGSSQYQQYCIHGSIRQQCLELLVDILMVVSDFVYTLLLEQYNMAASYDINKQNVGLFQVYRNEDHKHTIYQTDTRYICSCNYNTQFSLPCRHIFTVHIADKKVMNVNYIGARWIVSLAGSNTPQIENLNHLNENLVNNNEFGSEFLPFSNHDINEISDQQKHYQSTVNLLKDIEAISNQVGHIEINSTLAHFVEQLNSKYPLLQDDIGDPLIAKTKGRLNSSKHKKIGAEHATKKNYICGVCNNSGYNSRSCSQK
ncbi:14018_t:CDS:2, partial [Cetraspora pellucida]